MKIVLSIEKKTNHSKKKKFIVIFLNFFLILTFYDVSNYVINIASNIILKNTH